MSNLNPNLRSVLCVLRASVVNAPLLFRFLVLIGVVWCRLALFGPKKYFSPHALRLIVSRKWTGAAKTRAKMRGALLESNLLVANGESRKQDFYVED
jgi:hypothetical protein